MRLISLRLLAASSCLLVSLASAATRPRYGGTLRLQMKEAPASLDPASASISDWPAVSQLSKLLFDTLVVVDEKGQPHPALAIAWQSDSPGKRWQLELRQGVTFDDGEPLTAEAAAASLRTANPLWKVFTQGNSVVIQCESPDANLPAELALPRNSVVNRSSGKLSGTGPFIIAHWDPGKQLTLAANENYWRGRPFVDSIEIDMGKSPRAQMVALDLNQAAAIEVEPERARAAVAQGEHVITSQPADLMALVFARDPSNDGEGHLRQALALSIDRAALNDVVLQGGGEPAGGLLPNWISGYEFLFPSAIDLARARQERSMAAPAPTWTLGFDSTDPVMRVIAERIALNARDAGLTVQLTSAGSSDLRLVRVPLVSLDPCVALREFARELQIPIPDIYSDQESDLYSAERALLRSQRIIPLLHLRDAVGLQSNVEDWTEGNIGDWDLPNVWLEAIGP